MNYNPAFARKIINDPLYGFITVSDPLIFDIIQHPYFQRLRRIQQLGLASLVYPGALHTRFHHALGAMHLTTQAIETLRSKGFSISRDEALGVQLAILLHDIGHGPFSHALEYHIAGDISHEEITLLFMQHFNRIFGNRLDTAIAIFADTYQHRYLHQLVSGQLDMDRLDYLMRDSFYTGVSEGVINTDRILKMLTLAHDELAVELKGIYSIEKFIVARRLMYWQVYYHKTVIAAEYMLISIIARGRHLLQQGRQLEASPALLFFLQNKAGRAEFAASDNVLDTFALLDDYDLYYAVKLWANHSDPVLSLMCKALINRDLFRVHITGKPADAAEKEAIVQRIVKHTGFSPQDAAFLTGSGEISNNAYIPGADRILVADKQGECRDVSDLSEQMNIGVYSSTVSKFFTCYPKWADPAT